MFAHMIDVIGWGVAVTALAVLIAFLGEGRGERLVRGVLRRRAVEREIAARPQEELVRH